MNIISESYGLAVMAPDIEKYIDQYRSQVLEDFGKDLKTRMAKFLVVFFFHSWKKDWENEITFLGAPLKSRTGAGVFFFNY